MQLPLLPLLPLLSIPLVLLLLFASAGSAAAVAAAGAYKAQLCQLCEVLVVLRETQDREGQEELYSDALKALAGGDQQVFGQRGGGACPTWEKGWGTCCVFRHSVRLGGLGAGRLLGQVGRRRTAGGCMLTH